MATLAMPLTSVLASSATRSSVNSLGQAVDPVLHLLADVVVAHPAADQRQPAELVDRLGELVGELAGLGHGPRPQHEHEQRGEAEHERWRRWPRRTPRRIENRRCSLSTSGSRARAMSSPTRDAGEHRRGVAEERQQRQRAEHGEHQPDERAPVEAQAQPGPGGLLGIDAERRLLLIHGAMMTARLGRSADRDHRRRSRRRPWQARRVADETGVQPPATRATILRAGLTPGAAALLVAAVVAGFALAGAFELAHRTVGWVVACSVVALLIDPVVDVVARILPRWIAVIVVLLGVLAVIAALVVGIAHDLLGSLDELKENAPVAAQSLEQKYSWARRRRARRAGHRLRRRPRRAGPQGRRLQGRSARRRRTSSPGILMLFLLAYGRRYFEGFADQFAPPRRDRIKVVGQEAATRGRRYLLTAIGQSIANGVVVGLTCWAVGLPAAVSLGFVVGVLTVLPLIGVLVGGLPALLLAFGLLAWWKAVIVLVVLLALQAVEVAVVRPYVDHRTVRVGPTIPIIVGLLGFELYGVGGSVYGIALAVIALAALDAIGRQRRAARLTSGGRQRPEQ